MSAQSRRDIKRTRTGCWTCRRRRKRCDETRPSCNNCSDLGQMCEGYGIRLKWFTPRKTVRSSERSDDKKIDETNRDNAAREQSLKPDAATRAASLSMYLEASVFSSLLDIEKEILYDYADWGAATLNSKSLTGVENFAENLAGCSESTSMLLNCLTYQATLDAKYSTYVDYYYSRSLTQFRWELADPKCLTNICTLYSGLMLCDVSMNRGLPWTIHLNGLTVALQESGEFRAHDDEMRDLIDSVGILDLPTHTIGRKTPHLRIWKEHCCNRSGIEDVTGLPYSLIDLLASIAELGIEERLWEWRSASGDQKQKKIWQTAQYAGILAARALRREDTSGSQHNVQEGIGCSTATIQRTLLWFLQRLRTVMNDKYFTGRQALLFPLVVAGSQYPLLANEDRSFIRESMDALANGTLASDQYYGTTFRALQEFWAGDGQISFDQTVRDLDLELGIF